MVKTALLIGSSGGLGKSVLQAFAKNQWRVLCADLHKGDDAAPFFLIDGKDSISTTQDKLLDFVGSSQIDSVVNVAGGWAGGDISQTTTARDVEVMFRQSVLSSVVAAHVYARIGAPSSLLVLTGAAAATQPTPSMIAYGMAKSSVHFLCKSVAQDPAVQAKHGRVVCLLPTTLDTQGNREAMPDASRAEWTPLGDVADKIVGWSSNEVCPASGSLVHIVTKTGKTRFVIE
uniref:Dihydropteridine reductase n=1 Tax=Strigomonas oncopelti TaxID=5657 RepID=T1YT59_STROO|nr:6,7-dihydropteridine reductase [Strigomonas oncopelti]